MYIYIFFKSYVLLLLLLIIKKLIASFFKIGFLDHMLIIFPLLVFNIFKASCFTFFSFITACMFCRMVFQIMQEE